MKNKNITKVLLDVLYKASSLSIVLGVMISIIFVANKSNNILGQILPIIVFSSISAITSAIYMIILTREYSLVRMHMSKNWIFYDWISIYVNLINMIFSLSFITFFSMYQKWNTNSSLAIILICVVIVISLIGVGFHQYFIFKVNVDTQKRKNGENTKKDKKVEESKSNNEEVENAK